MPRVGGKKFPYTKEGIAAAKKKAAGKSSTKAASVRSKFPPKSRGKAGVG